MKATLVFVAAGLAVVLATPPAFAQKAQKGAQQAVAVDQLPTAVTAAVQKAYPQGTILSAATVTRAGQLRYELSVKPTADGQPIAVLASADGLIRTAAKNAPPSPVVAPVPAKGAKGPRKAAGGSAPTQGQTVAVDQLPKAVLKAIKDAYPHDTIVGATKTTSGSEVTYQLAINDVSSVIPLRVFVSADGTIQKR